MTYLLRRHLATLRSAEKPAAIAERKAYREAVSRASADRKKLYPVLTEDNFEEADRYQKERVAHWLDRAKAEVSA